jgi:hypothetical protein
MKGFKNGGSPGKSRISGQVSNAQATATSPVYRSSRPQCSESYTRGEENSLLGVSA